MRREVQPGRVCLKEERPAVQPRKLWVLLAVFRGYRVASEVSPILGRGCLDVQVVRVYV